MPVIPGRETPAKFSLSVTPIPAPPGYSALTYSGVGKATGYLACPIAPDGPWQVFAEVRWFKKEDLPLPDTPCIGIDALAAVYTSPTPAAYQYARR